jgi:organic hydroperoxide reductase OsmC/OhrA
LKLIRVNVARGELGHPAVMQAFPHVYHASASAHAAGPVTVASPHLPDIASAPPTEFGGPGGAWSPETLLCAALGDCFVLTFRGVSRAARFDWIALDCRVEGVLDRADRVTQFTRYKTFVTLTVAAGADIAQAHDLLERAERGCLIANSLRGTRGLEARVIVAEATNPLAA